LQEAFFLGLRLNRGVDLDEIANRYGSIKIDAFHEDISELISDGLMERRGEVIRLTARGRLLSNEVFQRFLAVQSKASV
jgi:oxygen-independent coproporphyrinogen-3 oxidase